MMTPAEAFPDATAAPTYVAFSGSRILGNGTREDVIRAARTHAEGSAAPALIFEEASGRQVDFDLRNSTDDAPGGTRPAGKAGPGRPRLGVVSREISLLPRHWDWLESQPNGASAAIRRLVDDARHAETGIERGRHLRNALGRVLWAVAGNFVNFEDAIRAIDARDDSRFDSLTEAWPKDVRDYALGRLEAARSIEAW